MMAFGAGALLFALTIVIFGEALHEVETEGEDGVLLMVFFAIVGSLFFQQMNRLLNNYGAFERKWATFKSKLKVLAKENEGDFIDSAVMMAAAATAGIGINPAPAEAEAEAAGASPETPRRRPGTTITMASVVGASPASQRSESYGMANFSGSDGDSDGFDGDLEATPSLSAGRKIRKQKAAASSVSAADAFVLHHARKSRRVPAPATESTGLVGDGYQQKAPGAEQQAADWQVVTTDDPEEFFAQNTREELKKSKEETHSGAGMAVWLGLMIDGLPESVIIGVMTVSGGRPSLSFILGVFLSNFPEAMSSSDIMYKEGYSRFKILSLWWTLAFVTGFGAGFAALIFPPDPSGGWHLAIMSVEGLAGGAMLTVIAQTMLPEAFEGGGDVTGFATLIGFLVTLLVEMLLGEGVASESEA
eukprot:TRINITY_DN4828_c0_g1_i1.p1 TRINITY_DN4828_c0_g1~~TRINITY_DN4828_c0_g1_i1.p1  ORF type:complete len:463 (+),score=113.41 TRINITY_DN4828_c0_g1_i1:137-1390(+)